MLKLSQLKLLSKFPCILIVLNCLKAKLILIKRFNFRKRYQEEDGGKLEQSALIELEKIDSLRLAVHTYGGIFKGNMIYLLLNII